MRRSNIAQRGMGGGIAQGGIANTASFSFFHCNKGLNVEFEKIKEHFRKHKLVYVSCGIGLASAGFTYLIMRGRYAGIQRVPDGSDMITIRPLSILSKQKVTAVTVIEREGRGHPGYIVKCLETGQIFLSQSEAAKALDAYPSVVSGHLAGKISDVHGLHLERVAA